MASPPQNSSGRLVPTLDDYAYPVERDIRFFDLDGVGHVNHASVAHYFEEGRLSYLLGINDPIHADPVLMLVHIAIDYLAQLHWPGKVLIGTRVGKFGRTSVHWEQAVFQDGQCVARAHSVMALADRSSASSVPIPDELRARLRDRGAGSTPPS